MPNPKLNRRGIPERVLTGKVPKYISVHRAYNAVLAQEMMKKLHTSFEARSKGRADDLGNSWKPLKPTTHAYKPLTRETRREYGIGTRTGRGILTPSQDKIWRGIYAKELKRLQKRGESSPEKKAAEKAWGILKAKGARTLIGLSRKTDINVRTGRLKASTRPGPVANNRYYAVRDQRVIIKPRSIKIKLTVPYISEVDRVRPVIPRNYEKWILDAHEVAIVVARRIYDDIQSRNTRRKGNPSKRSSSGRQGKRNRRNGRR